MQPFHFLWTYTALGSLHLVIKSHSYNNDTVYKQGLHEALRQISQYVFNKKKIPECNTILKDKKAMIGAVVLLLDWNLHKLS